MSYRAYVVSSDRRFRHGNETQEKREQRARVAALLATAADVLYLLGETSINKPPGRPSRFYKPVLSLDAAADQFVDLWLHTVPQDV